MVYFPNKSGPEIIELSSDFGFISKEDSKKLQSIVKIRNRVIDLPNTVAITCSLPPNMNAINDPLNIAKAEETVVINKMLRQYCLICFNCSYKGKARATIDGPNNAFNGLFPVM